MKLPKARKLAEEAIVFRMRYFAPQANLYLSHGMESGKTAHEKKTDLEESREVLEKAELLTQTVYKFATQKNYSDMLLMEDLARELLGKKPRKKGKFENVKRD
jgi:hypothetical protein